VSDGSRGDRGGRRLRLAAATRGGEQRHRERGGENEPWAHYPAPGAMKPSGLTREHRAVVCDGVGRLLDGDCVCSASSTIESITPGGPLFKGRGAWVGGQDRNDRQDVVMARDEERTTDAIRAEIQAERAGLDGDLAGFESEARRAGRIAVVGLAAIAGLAVLAQFRSRRRAA
jgi:hypothetical protein